MFMIIDGVPSSVVPILHPFSYAILLILSSSTNGLRLVTKRSISPSSLLSLSSRYIHVFPIITPSIPILLRSFIAFAK